MVRYSSTSNKGLLLCSFEVYFPDQRRIFIFSFGGVDKYLGGGGVLLLALAGAWWQRLERPRKKFNKICFLGLHGEI